MQSGIVYCPAADRADRTLHTHRVDTARCTCWRRASRCPPAEPCPLPRMAAQRDLQAQQVVHRCEPDVTDSKAGHSKKLTYAHSASLHNQRSGRPCWEELAAARDTLVAVVGQSTFLARFKGTLGREFGGCNCCYPNFIRRTPRVALSLNVDPTGFLCNSRTIEAVSSISC